MDYNISNNILEYFQNSHSIQNHRFRSWNHCYSKFKEARKNPQSIDHDTLTLHLAFYLASWGMYRGSSQLLQKDYRVHARIVTELQERRFHLLDNISAKGILSGNDMLHTLHTLGNQLRHLYSDSGVAPTDTLITKVILGVYGAVPAYDNYLIKGFQLCSNEDKKRCPSKISKTFNTNSVRQLAEFYHHNAIEFSEAYRRIDATRHNFPEMKMIDMYFWTIGKKISSGGFR